MYGYIYLITNLVNNKKYIGKRTKDFYKDSKYLGSGTLIKKAIAKYGFESFRKELLEECESLKQLNEQEVYWINKYNAVESNEFYNLATGANGSAKGSKRSEKTRQKLSKSLQGKKHPDSVKKKIAKTISSQIWINNGQIETKATLDTLNDYLEQGFVRGRLQFTDSARQNMSKAFTGRQHSEKTKKLISDITKGEKNGFYGKKHSDESKKKMSQKAKGRKASGETKQLLTKQRLGRKWINKDGINKFVRPEELNSYLKQGWLLGIYH